MGHWFLLTVSNTDFNRIKYYFMIPSSNFRAPIIMTGYGLP